jgi:hypothetical protein
MNFLNETHIIVFTKSVRMFFSSHKDILSEPQLMRFEFLTAVMMSMVIFWVVTPCVTFTGWALSYKSTWRHNPEDDHGHLYYYVH